MTATVKRMKRRRTLAVGFGILLVTAMVGVFNPLRSSAVVLNSPSNFESNDGNMTIEGNPSTDWNCFVNSDNFAHNFATPANCKVTSGATHIVADPVGETSWVNGQKFDTLCPLLAVNNNPPKDEFTDVASYNETGPAPNLDVFFYGSTIRPNTNGNSSGNVELNQTAGNGTTQAGCRTAGDRLIAYDFLNGGTGLNFHVLTWIDSTNPTAGGNSGKCFVKSDAIPCWGANVIVPSSGQDFEGEANQTAISAANNGMNGTALSVNAFAEFGVNLSKVLNLEGKCLSFPQQIWESRSSGSSFSSNPQDIEIESHTINNCGEIKIIKHTNPRGLNQVFSYTSSLPAQPTAGGVNASPCTAAGIAANGNFCLNDNGNTTGDNTANTVDATNVLASTYTVTEGTDPGGFTFDSLSCVTDQTSGSTTSVSGKTATIHLNAGGVVTCTYVNDQNSASMSTQTSTTTPVFPGVAVHDTATVVGSQATHTPSGNVTFFLCGPTALNSTTPCSSGGTQLSPDGTLSGSGTTASADSADVNTAGAPLAAGRYCFRAVWPGDTNYPGSITEFGGSQGTNECFVVSQITTTTQTTPSPGTGGTATFGTSVTDHAVITAAQSGGGPITGTVTFYVCDPTQVSGGHCSSSTGTLVNSTSNLTDLGTTPPSASADSSAVTVNKTGTWCFAAVYTPNTGNYTGSDDSTSDECFTVTDTTSSSSQQSWVPNDTATVSSDNGAPLNGTLSVQLYTGDSCGVSGGSAVSGQLYSKTANGTSSTATLTTTNSTFTVSTSASVSWLVTFTSTDANVGNSSHCEVSSVTITN